MIDRTYIDAITMLENVFAHKNVKRKKDIKCSLLL